MPITPRVAPGHRKVRLELDPKSATEVWFALATSLHSEETTSRQRALVAGLLPQFGRAIAQTGFVSYEMLLQFQRELATKPAPMALDAAVQRALEDR